MQKEEEVVVQKEEEVVVVATWFHCLVSQMEMEVVPGYEMSESSCHFVYVKNN